MKERIRLIIWAALACAAWLIWYHHDSMKQHMERGAELEEQRQQTTGLP